MSSNQQQQIERLCKLQEITRKNLQDIADNMGRIPSNGVVITQDRWDALFASWERANKQMQDVGNALNKLLVK